MYHPWEDLLMYKKIIAVVAFVLFALLAFLAVIITDLHDRDFPHDIGVHHKFYLDFSTSELSINEAFTMLEKLDARWNMGLIKIAPKFTKEGEAQVFATINDGSLPATFTWFHDDDIGRIVSSERLANSYPDGDYHVTGKSTHLDDFEDKLKSAGVKVNRENESIFNSLGFVVWEKGFAAAVLAASVLIITLALFWLSLKARGRALRVLGGCPAIRILVQDFAGFAGILLTTAGFVLLIATGYVGVFHGWVFIGTFLKALVSLLIAVITLSMIAALIMSVIAWPSSEMLASRQPVVKSLHSTARVVQAVTFLLVLSAVGPAWSTYQQSSTVALEMSQWKELSNQVAIVLATGLDEMDRMESQIGELVKEAESRNDLALSYTFTEEIEKTDNFSEYPAISFVNQQWIDLVMNGKSSPDLIIESEDNISNEVKKTVQENIEVLSRQGNSEEVIETFQFMRPVSGLRIPMAKGGGGGELHFSDNTLLVVIPSVYDTFNDSTLTSMISSQNIVFTGVTATQDLLKRNNLDVQSLNNQGFKGELNVIYIAEEGMLMAQYTAYVAWLQSLALIALLVAFTLACAISSLITARLQAKCDFPLRLAGQSWFKIIQSRVIKEMLVGVGLTGIVITIERPEAMWIVLMTLTYSAVIVLMSHFFTARWYFNGVSRRRI